mgnify:CR=1 FL=1
MNWSISKQAIKYYYRTIIQKKKLYRNPTYLEIAITDFCNLTCSLCSQATPLQNDKKTMSFNEIERISKFFKPYEFDRIKISGGEPTLHPEFAKISRHLNNLFPAEKYILATNGKKLKKYINDVDIYDVIDLTNYPGLNDKTYQELLEFDLPYVNQSKEEYTELDDVNLKNNTHKKNIYKSCSFTFTKKIVQSRIYACCISFGQSIRQNFDRNQVSVPIDKNWRENIRKLELESHCRNCWVKVNTSKFIPKKELKRAYVI